MCFNKEVSLVVFFFGLLASIKLFMAGKLIEDQIRQNSYYAVGIFTLVVSFMQLNEFFIWSNQDTKSYYHQIFSVFIYFTLFIQAVGLYFAVMYFDLINNYWSPEKIFLTILFVIQTAGFLYGLYYIGYKRFGLLKTVPTDCTKRLTWAASTEYNKYHHKMYLTYMISYFALNLMCTYYILGLPGLFISGLVIVLAMLYSLYRHCSYLQYGSMWCFTIVFLCATIFLFDASFIDSIKTIKF